MRWKKLPLVMSGGPVSVTFPNQFPLGNPENAPGKLEINFDEIVLLEAKLKNTTVKGKVREIVRYGEQMKISGESIDSHILAEFGLQGGIKLA